MMKRVAWIIAVLALVSMHGAPVRAGSLEVRVEFGRVSVNAHEVPLGEIVQALSQRAGVHVVLDARQALQPVTSRLEAGGILEAIVRLVREAGGGNYAIVSSNDPGRVEPFAFHEGGGAAPPPQASPPAPPASAPPPAYTLGDGSSTKYVPAPREPYEKPVAPSAMYGSIVSGFPGPAAPAALDADDDHNDHGPAAPSAKGKLAEEEYKRHLETTRRNLERDAKSTEEDD